MTNADQQNSLTEQIDMLAMQHTLALREWKSALSAVTRYQLDLQMRYLEEDIATLEATPSQPAQAPTRAPTLPTITTVDVMVNVQIERDAYQITVRLSDTAWTMPTLKRATVEQWLRNTTAPADVGRALYQHLQIGDMLAHVGGLARQQNARLRLHLRAPVDDSDVLALPWEYLHDDRRFILPHLGAVLLRDYATAEAPMPTTLDAHLRFLFTSSEQTDITAEAQALDALAEQFPISVQLGTVHQHSPMRFIKHVRQAAISRDPYRVWHHHGLVGTTERGLYLMMKGKRLSFNDLHQLMRDHLSLDLLFLWTQGTDIAPVSLQQAVSRLPVSTVIHMHSAQTLTLPRAFFQTLYTVATMRTIDEALARALQLIDYATLAEQSVRPPYILKA